MKIPPKLLSSMLAFGLLSSGTALAGSFTANFNTADTTGFLLGGEAFIETNRLILTPAVNSKSGSITLDDLDGGQAIEAFTATFKLQVGPGTANAADGLSFNFGPGIAAGGLYGEEGPGGSAVTVAFDLYDSGGGEAPAIDVKYLDKVLSHRSFTKAEMVTISMVDVIIQLKRNGTLSVTYKGGLIHDNVFLPGWAPVNGQFNISARTGGENAEMDIDDLSVTTTVLGTAIPTTISANPQSVTVPEGGSNTFSVTVDGTAPFSFQWVKSGVDILDATDRTLRLGPIYFADNNSKIKVRVTNPANTVTSTEANLTVTADTTRPTVTKVSADTTFTQVVVLFSEPVSDTALDTSRYVINNGIQVLGAVSAGANTIILTTSQLAQGTGYTLTINGVKDMATAGNLIVANTQIQFRSFTFQTGTIIHKKYNNLSNDQGEYSALAADPRYPNLPDRTDLLSIWEYPSASFGGRDGVSDPVRNWSDTSEGYFIPAVSGEYVFFINGADRIDLYLSENEDPANKHRIAYINGWTNPRGWLAGQGGTDMTRSRSDTDTGTEWPTGNTITLTANNRYYMMLYHHTFTWSGGDQNGVTFKLAGEPDPVAGDAPRLTGSVVGTFLDPTGASVSFSQHPTSVSILDNRTATLSGLATGTSAYGTNVTYQWQTAPSGSSTFTDIAGAVNSTFTTPTLAVADSGRKYRLLAKVPSATEISQVATVTVIADIIPPQLVSAGALPSQAGTTFDVGVTFDEPLDAASAGTMANYTLSAGTITAIKFWPRSPGVVLTVSGLTVGNTYTVTVANVADAKGNRMTSANRSFKVSGLKWDVVGGDELNLGNGVIAVSDNGFDIYSDGFTEWASYDEATMVYEQITGDFDKELRVEFQDASSQWARAGLIARDVSNFGVNRAAQEGGAAGRYQKIHVNPVVTAMGTGGNNSWEGNRRILTGGPSSGGITGVNSNPKYPNAWCRLKREGQTFTFFRSDDGVSWVTLGTTTWPDAAAPDAPMPATLYVGPEYTPENGNISVGLQGVFVAKIRDYRTHSEVVVHPALTYLRTVTGLTITYEGTLQSASSLTGTWDDVVGATSPYAVISTGQKFYRAKR